MPAAYVDENIFIRYKKGGKVAIQSWHVDEIREMAQQCSTIAELSRKLGYPTNRRGSNRQLTIFVNKHQIAFPVRKNYLAYEEKDGKWYKQCSKTKKIFGPVDVKEKLGEWFTKGNSKDGFRSSSRESDRERNKKYYRTPAGIWSNLKSSAKQRGIPFTLKKEWLEEESKRPETFNFCCYTGIEFDQSGEDESGHTKPLVRSYDRRSSSKGYTEENFAGWCCHIINSIKGEYSFYQITFILMLIINHLCKQMNIDTRLFLNKMLDIALNSTPEYTKSVLNKEINPTIHLDYEIAAK